jgi:hypothetical protein
MGAKRTPFTALAGHRRTMGRQGQKQAHHMYRESEVGRERLNLLLNGLPGVARLTSPDTGRADSYSASPYPGRAIPRIGNRRV